MWKYYEIIKGEKSCNIRKELGPKKLLLAVV